MNSARRVWICLAGLLLSGLTLTLPWRLTDAPTMTPAFYHRAKQVQRRVHTTPNDWFMIQRVWPGIELNRSAVEQARTQAVQTHSRSRSLDEPWSEAGPTNVGGRITALAVHPSATNIVYAGAALGGVSLLGIAVLGTDNWGQLITFLLVEPASLLYFTGAFSIIIIASALSGTLYLVIVAIVRRVLWCVEEQDGTLCWQCGHVLSDASQGVICPNCGRTSRNRAESKCKRRLLCIVRVALIMTLCLIAFMLIVDSRDTVSDASALRRLGTAGPLHWIPMIKVETSPAGIATIRKTWDTMGVCLETGRSDALLAVCIAENPELGQPYIQLQLMAKDPFGWETYGDPMIITDLDELQASQVLENGVPQSLLDAIFSVADNTGWQPKLPSPNTFGKFICVDPDEHFENPDGLGQASVFDG